MPIARLAISNFTTHRVRVLLTVAAIAMSVSLVVSVTSGYASLEASANKFLGRFMGTADAMISHQGDPRAEVPESVVKQLREDPDIKRVTGRLEVDSVLIGPDGKPIPGKATVFGLDRPADTRVENLRVKAGGWFDSADGDVAVIDQVASDKLKAGVGDFINLPGPDGQLKLKVVGIVQKPQILASANQSVYLPLHTLQRFTQAGRPPAVNRVMIDLQTKANLDDFMARWTKRLAAVDPALRLRSASDNRKKLDQYLQGLHIMSYLGGMASMLAATFIVFSALSMGVAERSRTLAMLRAIGALKSQVARLVVIEGILFAIVGVGIGIPLGWLWIWLLSLKFPHMFTAGVVLSRGGVTFGGLGSLLTAIAASLLPAWAATRVNPLEAMTPLAHPGSSKFPWLAALVGLILAAIDPAIMFLPWERILSGIVVEPLVTARLVKFFGHFAVGLPGIMLGFFLLAPAFVWTLERVAGPLVAAALGLRFSILRQQLTSGIWRAAGTCAALMVGLAILVAMETEGHTILSGWKIPDKFPDIFIVSGWTGLNPEQIHKLEHVKGIKPGELLPIALASPGLGSGVLALGQAMLAPDAAMFFGIDPEKGLNMLDLEFRQGNKIDATRQLKLGRHIIVTDEFYQLKHLGVGDTIPLQTTRHGTVNYTICGVVWSPSMDVIVSMFDMGRQFDQRTAGSLFGSMDDAKEDFDAAGNIHVFAANLDYFTSRDEVMKNVQDQVGVMNMRAGDVRQIKYDVEETFNSILLLAALVPMSALAVASLGVTNTIMASIRSRRWQLGILRSIGMTRWQLLRVVLAEAILVGIVGAGLGLAAGLVMAIDAHELTRVITGYAATLAVPWTIIAYGALSVMGVSILASLWPAISTAQAQPLALLQAGRAAT